MLQDLGQSQVRLETNQQDQDFNDEYTSENTGYSSTQRKQSRNHNQEQTKTVTVSSTTRGQPNYAPVKVESTTRGNQDDKSVATSKNETNTTNRRENGRSPRSSHKESAIGEGTATVDGSDPHGEGTKLGHYIVGKLF